MTEPECDAQILIRYLVGQPEVQFQRTREYFVGLLRRGEQISVSPATLSEVVFVLRGPVYGRSREQISAYLSGLLELRVLAVRERNVVERAVGVYRDHHPEWNDCLVAAAALEANQPVVSFDRGLDRIPGITRVEPGA